MRNAASSHHFHSSQSPSFARENSRCFSNPCITLADLGITRFRHAGRSTINVSDVMLLARRNEGLESIMRAFVDQLREQEEQNEDSS